MNPKGEQARKRRMVEQSDEYKKCIAAWDFSFEHCRWARKTNDVKGDGVVIGNSLRALFFPLIDRLGVINEHACNAVPQSPIEGDATRRIDPSTEQDEHVHVVFGYYVEYANVSIFYITVL